MKTTFLLLMVAVFIAISCETEHAKQQRLQKEEEQRIARLAKEEKEQKERELVEAYKDNSLFNGATPYSGCFGANRSCSDYGCSQIQVFTPSNSDVLVTIKSNGNVVRHAYIVAGSSYTFEMPNGTYQPFFYYGKGWYPDKVISTNSDCQIRGGFVSNEVFGKDDPQTLNNDILTYELILQQNGNFSTRPSNAQEAF